MSKQKKQTPDSHSKPMTIKNELVFATIEAGGGTVGGMIRVYLGEVIEDELQRKP